MNTTDETNESTPTGQPPMRTQTIGNMTAPHADDVKAAALAAQSTTGKASRLSLALSALDDVAYLASDPEVAALVPAKYRSYLLAISLVDKIAWKVSGLAAPHADEAAGQG